jgi:hypothetical protein
MHTRPQTVAIAAVLQALFSLVNIFSPLLFLGQKTYQPL